MEDIREFVGDGPILSALRDPRCRLILVLGGSDSGKTTFAARLAGRLARETAVGVVDLDSGQSRLGPPTTIGWGKVEGEFRSWERIPVEGFRFTGALSHAETLLPAVVGSKLMAEAALAACRKVVVDTSGLVSGPIGRTLKRHKIDLLAPDIVVAFERAGELSPILDPYAFQASPRLFRLPVPPSVGLKSPDRRVRHRRDLFAAYFAAARTVAVPLDAVGIRFTREPADWESERYEGRIVSFRDDRGRDLALGVIEDFRAPGRRLAVRTPLPAGVPFAVLVIGTFRLEREDGAEPAPAAGESGAAPLASIDNCLSSVKLDHYTDPEVAMGMSEEDKIAELAGKDPDFRSLVQEHRTLDEKLKEFDRKVYLTPDEEIERKRLQKLKLAKKDRIAEILSGHS